MEQDFSKGHLEELLRERTEEYNMYPTERVWNGIYHRLHTRRKWHFIGGGTFALMILAGVFVLMQDNTRPASKIKTTPSPLSARISPKGGFSGAGSDEPGTVNTSNASNESDDLGTAENGHLSLGTLSLSGKETVPSASLAAHLDPTLAPLGQYVTNNTTDNTVSGEIVASDKDGVSNGGRIIAAAMGSTEVASTEEITPLATDEDHNLHLRMIKNDAMLAAYPGNASALSASQKPLIQSKPAPRFSWLFHFEPSVSFRTLKSKAAIKTNYGFIVVDNNNYDINGLVNQRPSVGFELGTDFLYSLTSRLSLKAGLQFNYSRYTAEAINTSTPQTATLALGGAGTGGIPATTVASVTPYENSVTTGSVVAKSNSVWIPNQRVELSLPVGAEFQIMHNQTVSWNVAGTFQPTYILNAKAFLLSQDYKEYVQDPNLLRRWNMNVAAETFVRINRGKMQLQVGPQLRYQLQSSFISSYGIKEHLYDVGFKIGITQSIR